MTVNTPALTSAEIIDQAEKDLVYIYNRFHTVIDHGDGIYLYDKDGKEYLDFAAGIGVYAFGYNNEYYNNALKSQIDKVIHTSNYFFTEPTARAAHRVKELTGMERVFFTNSGAEAVEGAIKTAMKYAYLKDGRSDHRIIAMNNSFHGRTYGALSVTGNPKYRQPFGMMCDVKFADMNDINSVMTKINESTCAIIVEAIQGNGGLTSCSDYFLQQLRDLCDRNDLLLIIDEIQCGMGRTGDMFGWQKSGVKPDIMTVAKAIGGGYPVAAFLLNEKVAKHSMQPGDHGSTYGGNPLAGAAVNAVLDIYEELDLVNSSKEAGAYLTEKLDEIVKNNSCVYERRGRGLMQGLVFTKPVAPILEEARQNGLILLPSGPNIIRFLPPLIITKEDIDKMLEILIPAILNN